MAQKKSNALQAAEDKMISEMEESKASSFVDTFWEQFELTRDRARKMREGSEDAYLNVVNEVIKFNKQYRNSLVNLYEQGKKTNIELVTDLTQQFNFGKDEMKEEIKVESLDESDWEELKNQLKEVSGQLEKLALTPITSAFQVIEQLEDHFAKNTESQIAFTRERRSAWYQVRNEYVKLARNTHQNLVDRGMNSIRELVKAR